MKNWIWGRIDATGKTPIPEGLPSRAYWFQKLAAKYIDYDKLPWEMGYPHYEELDYIFPFIMREWKRRLKEQIENEREWQSVKQDNR